MSTTNNWEELKAEGNDLLNRGDSAGAAERYTQALALVPPTSTSDLQILYSNRSAANLKSNKYAEALVDAELCIAQNPNWAKAYNRQANALKELGRLEEASAACEHGLELEPGNAPLLALRKAIATARVVEKLQGVWHGMVAEEVGGYMQVFEFINDVDVIVRVLGTTVNAKYELNVTAEPYPHLDVHVPNSPGAAFVRHIYRFNDAGDLELCSPYLRPPEERPTEFAGMGLVVMKRGNYVRSEKEEAFRELMQSKSVEERTAEFLRQCIDAVPEIDVRPLETDSDEEIARKLTANVKFQTFYQTCTDTIGSEAEAQVKGLMLGEIKPESLEISQLVIKFRNAMFSAGLIAGNEVPEEAAAAPAPQQPVTVENVTDAPAASESSTKKRKEKKKKDVAASAAPAQQPAAAADKASPATTNWVPVLAAIAAIGVVAAVAGAIVFKNQQRD